MASSSSSAPQAATSEKLAVELVQLLDTGNFHKDVPAMIKDRLIDPMMRMERELSQVGGPTSNQWVTLTQSVTQLTRFIEDWDNTVQTEHKRIRDLAMSIPRIPFKNLKAGDKIEYDYVMAVERWDKMIKKIPNPRTDEELLFARLTELYNVAVFNPFQELHKKQSKSSPKHFLRNLTTTHGQFEHLRTSYVEMNTYVAHLEARLEDGHDKVKYATPESTTMLSEWEQVLKKVDSKYGITEEKIQEQLASSSSKASGPSKASTPSKGKDKGKAKEPAVYSGEGVTSPRTLEPIQETMQNLSLEIDPEDEALRRILSAPNLGARRRGSSAG